MNRSRLEQLHHFLKSNPKDPFLHHAIALEYVKQSDFQQAKDYFLQALKIDEMYIGSYYHLGKLYESLEDWDQALETYIRGMEVAKKINDRKTYSELAMAHEILEDSLDN